MGLALLYGLITRLVFGASFLHPYIQIVSLSYLLLMPAGFGALTTFLGRRYGGWKNIALFAGPVLVVVLGMLLAALTHLEAVFCLVVALPVLIPMTLLGSLIMKYFLDRGDGRLQVTCLVLLPYLLAPVEEFWHRPPEIVTVENVVHVRATPEQVWQQIASVPAIPRDALPSKVIYLLKFPRPIAATLEQTPTGLRRRATFERGVCFFENVTTWEPARKLAFSIRADPAFIPHTAFDQHIIVGGRFFDVLDGAYEIEPLADGGGCNLHLNSRHRLGTVFNFYASLWSRWVMHEIQDSILSVIVRRAEAKGSAQAGPPAPRAFFTASTNAATRAVSPAQSWFWMNSLATRLNPAASAVQPALRKSPAVSTVTPPVGMIRSMDSGASRFWMYFVSNPLSR